MAQLGRVAALLESAVAEDGETIDGTAMARKFLCKGHLPLAMGRTSGIVAGAAGRSRLPETEVAGGTLD